MSVYVLRHGQTDWNKDYVIQGRIDIPLNETGIEQAKEAREKLKDIPISLCISSPLKRALQTAEIACEGRDIKIITDPRIIEMAYGEYEGVSRNDEGYHRQRREIAARYPGGESYLDVAQRIFNFLDELKEKHRDENVLLVTHGGVGRAIRAYFIDDLETENFLHCIFKNAEIDCFEFPDRDNSYKG